MIRTNFFKDHNNLFVTIICLVLMPHFCQAQQSIIYLFDSGISARYDLSFEENFNAPIDAKKWLTAYPWGRHLIGNTPEEESLEYYTPDGNLVLQDGIASLIAKKEKVCGIAQQWEDSAKVLKNGLKNYRCYDYSSAMLYSNAQFGYGYYEIRFKQSENSKGLWPAFWLYADGNEIDIFENKGERPNETHWDLHCKSGCRKKYGGWIKLNTNFTKQFNIISLDWNEDGQRWFCNGENYRSAKQHYGNRMNIILTNGVSRDKAGGGFWVGADASTSFPSSLDVDYVRYYKTVYAARKWSKKIRLDETVMTLINDKTNGLSVRLPNMNKNVNTLITLAFDGQKRSVKVANTSKEKAMVYIYNSSKKLLKQQTVNASSAVDVNDLPDETLIVVVKNGNKTLADKLDVRR